MSNYTEADYYRDLGITSPDPVPVSARVAEAGPRGRGWDLYQQSLGIDATPTESKEARRQLAENEDHPWRLEWRPRERWHRRGQEVHLAHLYTSRLGESATAADAHVHRVLSAAWQTKGGLREQIEATARALDREITSMEAKAPVSTRESAITVAETGWATDPRRPRAVREVPGPLAPSLNRSGIRPVQGNREPYIPLPPKSKSKKRNR